MYALKQGSTTLARVAVSFVDAFESDLRGCRERPTAGAGRAREHRGQRVVDGGAALGPGRARNPARLDRAARSAAR
jgi:hypothetical protein